MTKWPTLRVRKKKAPRVAGQKSRANVRSRARGSARELFSSDRSDLRSLRPCRECAEVVLTVRNGYSVVGHYTNNLVFDRIAYGLLTELQVRSPKDEKGRRRGAMHQWFTEDIGDPMLAQHLHTLIMFQRLAIANGHGWNRFLHTVDQVLPRRGDTLPLPFGESLDGGNEEAAN
jgi:P63C domain